MSAAQAISVRVNGRRHELEPPASVRQLLERLEITARYALVERNGAPLEHGEYTSTLLEDGDELVIARPVAGG